MSSPIDGFVTIRRVSNGFIVEPPIRGDRRDPEESHVFNHPDELGDFIQRWACRHTSASARTPEVGGEVFYRLPHVNVRGDDAVPARVIAVHSPECVDLQYKDLCWCDSKVARVKHSTTERGCWFRVVPS